MRFKAVFWDVDGTLYDTSAVPPDDEMDLLNVTEPLVNLPPLKLKFFIPYAGLETLLSKIPKKAQGIISNNYHQLQMDKLRLLRLDKYFDRNLIFTSYGEAAKVLSTENHPLKRFFYPTGIESVDLADMSERTAKPNDYMFKVAAAAMKVKPKDCLMIGDECKDIIGAQKAGMKALYIAGVQLQKEDIRPEYRVQKGDIRSISEILDVH